MSLDTAHGKLTGTGQLLTLTRGDKVLLMSVMTQLEADGSCLV